MGYKGLGKECRYKDTSGKKLDAANPQTTGELPFFLTPWEVLRDAKAPRWPRRGVFASRTEAALLMDQAADRVELGFGHRAIAQPVGPGRLQVALDLGPIEPSQERAQQ